MIYICDFEDSFTYNILSELKLLGLNCSVINFEHIFKFLQSISKTTDKTVVILGPGPGHPDEYQIYKSLVAETMQNPYVFVMGVCLGHQLILQTFGKSVEHCVRPIHGESRSYKLTKSWSKLLGLEQIHVQHYNSLIAKDDQIDIPNVDVFTNDGEILMASGKQFLSYQFHPESLGTSCPERYFGCLRNFLYNE